MWIETAGGFVNSLDVLLVQLRPEKEEADLFALSRGEFGKPRASAGTENYQRVGRLVREWCHIGANAYLNLERFSRVDVSTDSAGEAKAIPYLPRIDLGKEFIFHAAQAETIHAWLQARAREA